MVKKGNKMLQVSVPAEIVDSMNIVTKAISKETGILITKGMLITNIYVQWLEFQGKQIEKAEKEEKKDA